MNGLMAWMEKYIYQLPQNWCTETSGGTKGCFYWYITRDNGGSVAVMINAIIRDLPQEFVSTYAASLEADKGIFAVLNVIIGINGFV